ncbi:MAG: hypothetical protein QM657_07250 [Lacrimispora sp.]|uniref:hypothetical protein n=1 Tax=Lacrimispora sp. TaxID=2719234 RepID=UPI0039E27E5A
MCVHNEEEFGEALREGRDKIEIEGDLASKVKKLYKINLALWNFCLVCLAVTIIALMQIPITGGSSTAVSLVAGTPLAAIVGTKAAVSAVMIAVAGGGIQVLYKLRRDYRMLNEKDGRVIIYLKK